MEKLIFIILSFGIFGCDGRPSTAKPDEKHDFFPVNSFIKGQIHEVDSLKLPLHKYSTINNITDSVLLSQEQFDSLALEFIEQDINDPSINKFYKETSFADQSIPSVTFTYSTQNNDLTLQRTDVIIHPDPVLNDQVRSVYLEKISKSGDTIIVKKLYWQTARSFEIISSKKIPAGPELTSLLKVTWD